MHSTSGSRSERRIGVHGTRFPNHGRPNDSVSKAAKVRNWGATPNVGSRVGFTIGDEVEVIGSQDREVLPGTKEMRV